MVWKRPGKILLLGLILTVSFCFVSTPSVATPLPIGRWNIAVFAVDFPDFSGQTPIQFYTDLLFGEVPPSGIRGSMKSYYKEVSYDQLILTGQVNDGQHWLRLPRSYKAYAGLDLSLLEDAVQAALAAGFNFTPFDTDNDGVIDALMIIMPFVDLSANATERVSDSRVDTGATNQLGNRIFTGPFAIVSTPVNITAPAHEFGHILGLPDLYDPSFQSAGLGSWSLMSTGTTPNAPHLDAWSKVALGWVNPTLLDAKTDVNLPPVEDHPSIYKIPILHRENEYFLLENRQQTGFDFDIRGAGLLIYHVDENMSGNSSAWYPGCTSCSEHYKVALLQADGLWQLEKSAHADADPGDPYPGSAHNVAFTTSSNPSSNTYQGTSSGVAITDIHLSGQNVLATVSFPPPPAADLVVGLDDAPDPIGVGGELKYTITVTNNGPPLATGVTLTDTLPSEVLFGSLFASQGSCTGTTAITCNLGNLDNGAKATVTISVTATAAGTINNTAHVTSEVSDPNDTNNSATASTIVTGPPPPTKSVDLVVAATSNPNPATVGSPLTYTVTVTNKGPDTATGVTLTDTPPTGVTVVSITSTVGTCSSASANPLSCDLQQLLKDATATVTITVTPLAAATLSNTSRVTGAEPDPDNSNNAIQLDTTAAANSSQSSQGGGGGCSMRNGPMEGKFDPMLLGIPGFIFLFFVLRRARRLF